MRTLTRRVKLTLIVALGVVVLLGVGLAVVRWWWLPGYRPALQKGEAYGIDVSSHQGDVDWADVRGDHIAFAYIKATEGVSYTDPDFGADVSDAVANRIAVGGYHFFSLCDPGVAQADHFLAAVGGRPMTLPPALDLEFSAGCRARPSPGAVVSQVDAFVQTVRARTGRPVLVYETPAFAGSYPQVTATMRWVPHYFFRPGGSWVVWQVDGGARVHGVTGTVDLDVGRLSPLTAGRS